MATAPVLMTESGVHLIVKNAFESYEQEVAQPRHLQNTTKLDELIALVNNVKGGVTAIKWIGRIVGGAYALVKIAEFAIHLAKGKV